MSEFPSLEKYLKVEPSYKMPKDDDYEADILTHWIFASYGMTIEQKKALYKKKKLKNLDPTSKLYDAISDNIDKIIFDNFTNQSD